MGILDSLPTLAEQGKCAKQKWEEPSRVDAQLEADKADEANRRAVYRHVTLRDGHCCRVCGRWCNPEALTLLEKGHHHHIVYESAQGPTTVENVCLLCAACHDAEHVTRRISIEGNAEASPWLTLSKKEKSTGHWYVWRQENGVRTYARD